MKILLFLLLVLCAGCGTDIDPPIETRSGHGLHFDGPPWGAGNLQIVEFKGHRFAIASYNGMVALCEVTDASAVKAEIAKPVPQ